MTLPTQLLMQLRATPRTMDAGQFDKSRLGNTVLPSTLQDSPLGTARLSHQAARATLAKLFVFHRPCNRFAALHGRQNFFVSASFSTA